MSHGAGVLLGNMQNYGGVDEASLRELNNDSKTSGNLKSVYAMRVSHSNLASKAGGKPPPNATHQAKRNRLKSAVPRSSKPTNLTMNENILGNANFSQQDISTAPDYRQALTGNHKNMNMMSTLSSKQNI